MIEERFIIMDRQWTLIEPHCLGKKSDPGRTGGDGRLFLEAVLWIARLEARGVICQVNRVHSEISVNCRRLLYAISMA